MKRITPRDFYRDRPARWLEVLAAVGGVLALVGAVAILALGSGCSDLSAQPLPSGGWAVHGWFWPLAAFLVLAAILRGSK